MTKYLEQRKFDDQRRKEQQIRIDTNRKQMNKWRATTKMGSKQQQKKLPNKKNESNK